MFCSCNMHNMQWKWFSTHCDAITSYDSCSCIKIILKDHSFYYVLTTFMVTLASPVCVILFLSLDVNFNLPVSVLWYNSSVFFFHNLLPSVWDAYSIWTSFVLSASIPWSIKTLVHETLWLMLYWLFRGRVPLSIYKEDSNSVDQSEVPKRELNSWHTLGPRAERNKENTAIPSKWTSYKVSYSFLWCKIS